MKFDIVNMMAVVSAVVALIFIVKTFKEALSDKQRHPKAPKAKGTSEGDVEYQKMVNSIYDLEHERQRNTGDHYEDESIYLNRAEAIRKKTEFFTFVNN